MSVQEVSSPYPVKIEEDQKVFIDLDTESNSPADIVIEWHLGIRRFFGRHVTAAGENKLEYIMKEYIAAIRERAVHFEDIEKLLAMVDKHIDYIYWLYHDLDMCFSDKFLDNMEHIMTFYINLTLRVLLALKERTKVTRKMVFDITQKLIKRLSFYLLKSEYHIFHVLIRQTTTLVDFMVKDVLIILNSNICKQVFKNLYMQFLVLAPLRDMSDEAFCRAFILFENWKALEDYRNNDEIDQCIENLFKRGKEYMRANVFLRKILQPEASIMTELMKAVGCDPSITKAYFDYIKSKKKAEAEILDDIGKLKLDEIGPVEETWEDDVQDEQYKEMFDHIMEDNSLEKIEKIDKKFPIVEAKPIIHNDDNEVEIIVFDSDSDSDVEIVSVMQRKSSTSSEQTQESNSDNISIDVDGFEKKQNCEVQGNWKYDHGQLMKNLEVNPLSPLLNTPHERNIEATATSEDYKNKSNHGASDSSEIDSSEVSESTCSSKTNKMSATTSLSLENLKDCEDACSLQTVKMETSCCKSLQVESDIGNCNHQSNELVNVTQSETNISSHVKNSRSSDDLPSQIIISELDVVPQLGGSELTCTSNSPITTVLKPMRDVDEGIVEIHETESSNLLLTSKHSLKENLNISKVATETNPAQNEQEPQHEKLISTEPVADKLFQMTDLKPLSSQNLAQETNSDIQSQITTVLKPMRDVDEGIVEIHKTESLSNLLLTSKHSLEENLNISKVATETNPAQNEQEPQHEKLISTESVANKGFQMTDLKPLSSQNLAQEKNSDIQSSQTSETRAPLTSTRLQSIENENTAFDLPKCKRLSSDSDGKNSEKCNIKFQDALSILMPFADININNTSELEIVKRPEARNNETMPNSRNGFISRKKECAISKNADEFSSINGKPYKINDSFRKTKECKNVDSNELSEINSICNAKSSNIETCLTEFQEEDHCKECSKENTAHNSKHCNLEHANNFNDLHQDESDTFSASCTVDGKSEQNVLLDTGQAVSPQPLDTGQLEKIKPSLVCVDSELQPVHTDQTTTVTSSTSETTCSNNSVRVVDKGKLCEVEVLESCDFGYLTPPGSEEDVDKDVDKDVDEQRNPMYSNILPTPPYNGDNTYHGDQMVCQTNCSLVSQVSSSPTMSSTNSVSFTEAALNKNLSVVHELQHSKSIISDDYLSEEVELEDTFISPEDVEFLERLSDEERIESSIRSRDSRKFCDQIIKDAIGSQNSTDDEEDIEQRSIPLKKSSKQSIRDEMAPFLKNCDVNNQISSSLNTGRIRKPCFKEDVDVENITRSRNSSPIKLKKRVKIDYNVETRIIPPSTTESDESDERSQKDRRKRKTAKRIPSPMPSSKYRSLKNGYSTEIPLSGSKKHPPLKGVVRRVEQTHSYHPLHPLDEESETFLSIEHQLKQGRGKKGTVDSQMVKIFPKSFSDFGVSLDDHKLCHCRAVVSFELLSPNTLLLWKTVTSRSRGYVCEDIPMYKIVFDKTTPGHDRKYYCEPPPPDESSALVKLKNTKLETENEAGTVNSSTEVACIISTDIPSQSSTILERTSSPCLSTSSNSSSEFSDSINLIPYQDIERALQVVEPDKLELGKEKSFDNSSHSSTDILDCTLVDNISAETIQLLSNNADFHKMLCDLNGEIVIENVPVFDTEETRSILHNTVTCVEPQSEFIHSNSQLITEDSNLFQNIHVNNQIYQTSDTQSFQESGCIGQVLLEKPSLMVNVPMSFDSLEALAQRKYFFERNYYSGPSSTENIPPVPPSMELPPLLSMPQVSDPIQCDSIPISQTLLNSKTPQNEVSSGAFIFPSETKPKTARKRRGRPPKNIKKSKETSQDPVAPPVHINPPISNHYHERVPPIYHPELASIPKCVDVAKKDSSSKCQPKNISNEIKGNNNFTNIVNLNHMSNNVFHSTNTLLPMPVPKTFNFETDTLKKEVYNNILEVNKVDIIDNEVEFETHLPLKKRKLSMPISKIPTPSKSSIHMSIPVTVSTSVPINASVTVPVPTSPAIPISVPTPIAISIPPSIPNSLQASLPISVSSSTTKSNNPLLSTLENKTNEISYPATPMLSIADVYNPLAPRPFKTPAEKKQLPPNSPSVRIGYNSPPEPIPYSCGSMNTFTSSLYHMNECPFNIKIDCPPYCPPPPPMIFPPSHIN